MTVHRRGVDWEASEVFAAALRWRVSYYDALYLVIAQKVGATYWTADRKLLRYLQRQKFSDLPQVGWIGNFKSPQT
jgi:predicted nucleic acid-binding protein